MPPAIGRSRERVEVSLSACANASVCARALGERALNGAFKWEGVHVRARMRMRVCGCTCGGLRVCVYASVRVLSERACIARDF